MNTKIIKGVALLVVAVTTGCLLASSFGAAARQFAGIAVWMLPAFTLAHAVRFLKEGGAQSIRARDVI